MKYSKKQLEKMVNELLQEVKELKVEVKEMKSIGVQTENEDEQKISTVDIGAIKECEERIQNSIHKSIRDAYQKQLDKILSKYN